MKKTIAIGSEGNRPTWEWVGFDLARELSKYYDIKVFAKETLPPCDAAIVIKEPLPEYLLDFSKPRHVIYFPCDYYTSGQEMENDRFLKRCSAVVSHSKLLVEKLKELNPHVFLVNHNGKYILPKMNEYKKEGFVLWIGFSMHAPYLRQWLTGHPLDRELVILTDYPYGEYVPGKVVQLKWSPKVQFEMLSSAKAAIDIKGGSFNQLNRPPEKLQTFIASGIPCACNSGPITDFLKERGFEVASPDNAQRWFSREYYDATIEFGRKLREETSLENVGLAVKKIIDDILLK